jgi:hypothetical protein
MRASLNNVHTKYDARNSTAILKTPRQPTVNKHVRMHNLRALVWFYCRPHTGTQQWPFQIEVHYSNICVCVCVCHVALTLKLLQYTRCSRNRIT